MGVPLPHAHFPCCLARYLAFRSWTVLSLNHVPRLCLLLHLAFWHLGPTFQTPLHRRDWPCGTREISIQVWGPFSMCPSPQLQNRSWSLERLPKCEVKTQAMAAIAAMVVSVSKPMMPWSPVCIVLVGLQEGERSEKGGNEEGKRVWAWLSRCLSVQVNTEYDGPRGVSGWMKCGSEATT